MTTDILSGRYQFPIDAVDALSARQAMIELMEDFFGERFDANALGRMESVQIDMVALWTEAMFRRQDVSASNATLGTAVDPQSILDIAYSEYHYTPRGARSAQHTVTLTAPAGSTIVIPKGTVLKSAGSASQAAQSFETLKEVTLEPDALSAQVEVRHGSSQTVNVSGDGSAGFTVDLDVSSVDLDTLEVSVEGVVWERQTTLASSRPSDTHYRVALRAPYPGQLYWQVIFGNGVYGRKVQDFASVSIAFVSGVGEAGNVPKGTITSTDQPLLDASGRVLNVSITNTGTVVRGRAMESLSSVRVNAPLAARTHTGMVSLQNYGDVAQTVEDGAARAISLSRGQEPTIQPNTVLIYVVFDLLSEATQEELDALKARMIGEYAVNGTSLLVVAAAPFNDVTLDVEVVLHKGRAVSSCEDLVQSACDAFFSLESTRGPTPEFVVDIGKPIAMSHFVDWLSALPCVDQVNLPSINGLGSISPGKHEVLRVTTDLTVKPSGETA